jgi:hypothetical protein
MNLCELLRMRNREVYAALTKHRVKAVRHQDHPNRDIHALYEKGCLEIYQQYQKGPIFEKCDFVVSFLGVESTHAKFTGMFRRMGRGITRSHSGFRYPTGPKDLLESVRKSRYWYQLEKIEGNSGFADLKDRLIIDWGQSTRSWHQWLQVQGKDVVEILPEQTKRNFPGYFHVCERYEDICKILKNKSSHRDWHDALSEVAGVYLILDANTGKQYVGSAYGQRGILGRWNRYVQRPHGDNKRLKEIIANNPAAAKNFQFTILHIMSLESSPKEVIECEQFFKKKLGSNAFGLNSN